MSGSDGTEQCVQIPGVKTTKTVCFAYAVVRNFSNVAIWQMTVSTIELHVVLCFGN